MKPPSKTALETARKLHDEGAWCLPCGADEYSQRVGECYVVMEIAEVVDKQLNMMQSLQLQLESQTSILLDAVKENLDRALEAEAEIRRLEAWQATARNLHPQLENIP